MISIFFVTPNHACFLERRERPPDGGTLLTAGDSSLELGTTWGVTIFLGLALLVFLIEGRFS